MIFFLFLAIFADVVAPYRYDKVDFANVRIFPFVQEAHPFQTDKLGAIFSAGSSMALAPPC